MEHYHGESNQPAPSGGLAKMPPMTGGPGKFEEFHRPRTDLRLLTVHPIDARTSDGAPPAAPSFADALPPGSRMRALSVESLKHLPRPGACTRSDDALVPERERRPLPADVVTRWSIEMRTEMGQRFGLSAWDVDLREGAPGAPTISDLRWAKRASLRHQPLFHEMLVVESPRLLEDLALLRRDGQEIDADAVDLIMTPESRRNRPEYRLTSLPAAANRHPGTLAAVQPRSSVWAGQPADYVFAVACSIGGVLVALELLRTVREEALEALRGFRAPNRSRQALGAALADLERMRLDISFGVEANLPNRFTAATQPVHDLAAHLAEALGVPGAASATRAMVEQLADATDTREARLAAAEAGEADRRRAAWSVIALLAIPATLWLSFLGANVRETEAGGRAISMWGMTSLLYLAGFVAVAALAAAVLGRRAKGAATSA